MTTLATLKHEIDIVQKTLFFSSKEEWDINNKQYRAFNRCINALIQFNRVPKTDLKRRKQTEKELTTAYGDYSKYKDNLLSLNENDIIL